MQILFNILFLFVPLVMWPYTSEIFEFNKILFVYIITTLVVANWIAICIQEKKIIFRRTILDIPILIFLGSQLISTILSIDPRTSFLGYYSRFNGGFLSIIYYSLLYWAFVSNLSKKQAINSIYYTLYSFVLVCLYGIFQHFGIDKQIWVQDVQNRVFSTLGQPNWLAASLVALIPIVWNIFITKQKHTLLYLFSFLFFVTLLFTKSRSGLLGFAGAYIIFWISIYFKDKFKYLKHFLILNGVFVVLFFLIQSPFSTQKPIVTTQMPALETGGTESGDIRKIVWKGAFEIWKHYPVFGSGLETFAYIYPNFRPPEHNLVSEWDFIYNKAHNEYLNTLSTSGLFGLSSYLVLIGISIYLFWKLKRFDFLAGYVGILITNFFGFSVVVTQLFLFLFPAIAIVLEQENSKTDENKNRKLDFSTLLLVSLPVFLFLYLIFGYWQADINYNKGKIYNTQKPEKAVDYLLKSIKFSPKEPIYHIELAKSYVLLNKSDESIKEAEIAIKLSPANVNLKRVLYTIFVKLANTDPNYLIPAQKILEEAIIQAPTDAKLYYNLGVTLWRMRKFDEANKVLQKTIELKPNYKEGRFAYALLLEDLKNPEEAKKQLEYILKFIDPKDELTKEELQKIHRI